MGQTILPVVETRLRGRWQWDEVSREHPLRALGRGLIGIVHTVEFAGLLGPPDWFRGLPSDWSGPRDPEELRKILGVSPRGASWVLLREIEEFPWDAQTTMTGWVPLKQWKSWDLQSSLDPWLIRDPETRFAKFEPEEWNRLEREGVAPGDEDLVLIRATFPHRKRDDVPEFFESVLPWLRSLGGPDDVRLVYGIFF